MARETRAVELARKRPLLARLHARSPRTYARSHGRVSAHRSARVTGLFDHISRYPECPFILQYNIAIGLDELWQTSGVQEFPPSEMDVVWGKPLDSLRALGAFEPGKYDLCASLLTKRERFELSLYAQSARAHILSTNRPPGYGEDLTAILASMDEKCREARCWQDEHGMRIDSWRALQPTRAVVLAAVARARVAQQTIGADQQAHSMFYEGSPRSRTWSGPTWNWQNSIAAAATILRRIGPPARGLSCCAPKNSIRPARKSARRWPNPILR